MIPYETDCVRSTINELVQKRLLYESKLTFEQAVEIAQGVGLVDQQTKTMKSGDSKHYKNLEEVL